MTSVASAQIPAVGDLTLDHLAYFVPHVEGASAALEQLGFTLTPFSPHSHRLEPGSPVTPAGTANRCVMLERGYLEFLTPTGDTGIATQLRTAIKRYVGVHSIVFGTSAPDADYGSPATSWKATISTRPGTTCGGRASPSTCSATSACS